MLPVALLFLVLSNLASLTTASLLNPNERVSRECKPINSGQHLCCAKTLKGDQPAVIALALLMGYHLNPNDVSGIDCEETPFSSCAGTELCCQVTGLIPIIVFYCQPYTTTP